MYQVRKKDIIQYAEECLQDERLQLFNLELVTHLKKVNTSNQLPMIDTSTANDIHYCLRYLKFYQIISEDTFRKGEKNPIMRIQMKGFAKSLGADTKIL